MFRNMVRKQVIKTLKKLVNFNGQAINVSIEGENINFKGVIYQPEEAIDIIKQEGKKAVKNSEYVIKLNDGTKEESLTYSGSDVLKLVSML